MLFVCMSPRDGRYRLKIITNVVWYFFFWVTTQIHCTHTVHAVFSLMSHANTDINPKKQLCLYFVHYQTQNYSNKKKNKILQTFMRKLLFGGLNVRPNCRVDLRFMVLFLFCVRCRDVAAHMQMSTISLRLWNDKFLSWTKILVVDHGRHNMAQP